MEKQITPYYAALKIEGERVLVLAAHPGDEIFGCGGATMRHVAAGNALQAIILSDGEFNADTAWSSVCSELRRAESSEAARFLCYDKPQFWGMTDHEVVYGEFLVQRIEAAVLALKADLVYAPSIYETRPGHRALGMASLEAARRSKAKFTLAMYELEVPMLKPNLLLNISDLRELKQKAMSCFASKLQEQPYDQRIAALNCFRSRALGSQATAAEAFFVAQTDDLKDDVLKIYESEYQRQQDMGLVVMPEDVPLVSVLIRSMDRPQLQTALDSLALQTYTNIEAIVINAQGKEHRMLGTRCGRFPLRMVSSGKPLMRSHAANVGLDNAGGDYIMFLDDDDWLYPDHISLLVEALQKSNSTKAAYSGVKFTVDSQSREFRVINEKFDPIRLLHGNFIPIHAVLFSKSLTKTGCRFDESLNVYEDWDFWLQVNRLTPFLHVDVITAGYRSTGNSCAGPSANEESIQMAREVIFDKWKSIWSGPEINLLLIYVAQLADLKIAYLEEQIKDGAELTNNLQDTLVEVNVLNETLQDQHMEIKEELKQLLSTIDNLEKRCGERDNQLGQKDLHIHNILSSKSWKLTSPARKLLGYARNLGFKVKALNDSLIPLLKDPKKIYPTLLRLKHAHKRSGLRAVKNILLQLPYEITYNEVWVNQYQNSFTAEVLESIQKRIKVMKNPPLISILMPTYNTPEKILRETIQSVLLQLYPFWELCIVDDASSQSRVRSVLQEIGSKDQRIKTIFLESNGGIAMATNCALDIASGQFSVLLDHDDLLEKQALFRLAESIIGDDPDMIYSDEALLSDDGMEVVNHVHRPAFSPEYLRSCPYIVHLVAFRTDLLREIGGLDISLKISQDYDLILRASEKAKKIVHIPEILYLWRQRKQSTGHQLKHKVMEISRKVLSNHLLRCEELGVVNDGAHFNYFNVCYPLQSGLKIAIIIPTKNHGELVRQCVDSIVRTVKTVPYDIIVVDHASDDIASLEYFKHLQNSHQVLRYEGVFNFSAINNWAISHLKDEYTHYLFCNNDIEAIEDGWLEKMIALGQKSDVGIVGAKLLYPDKKMIQHAGVCIGMYGIAEHYGKFMDDVLPNNILHPGYHGSLITNHEMSAVTAACALMRRDAFECVGGYEDALAVGFGDVDLCLKSVEAGYRVLFCADAILIHHESYTRGKSSTDPHPKDSAYFSKKWRGKLDLGDPYYNPNMTLLSTKWEIKQPMVFNLENPSRVWTKSIMSS